jgi:formylglycine-generating enzyme required for sulfatase activity
LSFQSKTVCADPAGVDLKLQVAQLIGQLGHSRFTKRVAATRLLDSIGEAALPALRTAARQRNDLEVQRRARLVIARILDRVRHSQSTGLELVVIKVGKFSMGSPAKESGRQPDEWQHEVQITRPFLLGKYEVTQGEYEKVMKATPSAFRLLNDQQKAVAGADVRKFPVEQVTWFDAIAFCNQMSTGDGYPPYYDVKSVRLAGSSIVRANVVLKGGSGFRLPTEAEWEFACRAYTTTPFHFGTRNTGKESNVKTSPRRGGYGIAIRNWKDLKRTVQVGNYPPNWLGLHDMSGNVAEWVEDWYDKEYYRKSPAKDPPGPKTGRHRVLRGGSWLVAESSARSASRYYQTPDERKNYIGFRVARTP